MSTVYSVSQINSYIKHIFSNDRVLTCVCVRGEVSNCKYHSSGHIYFTLKDESGQLACVMFAGKRISGLKFNLEEGQSVIVTGSVSIYERDGKYQLYADTVEKEGLGALYEQFERTKLKLESEGLFDPEHKKSIPAYVKTVGIVTASTGAVIHDICATAARRNPYVRLILSPAAVQGKGAAQSLIKALKRLIELSPDVIIIGRGGGSTEDLFEFNDEALARAIYACPIPIISAVGHEVDFTIADYVSDLRAATPTAAAEIAIYDYREFYGRLIDTHSALLGSINNKIAYERMKLQKYNASLVRLSPDRRLEAYRIRAEKYSSGLKTQFYNRLADSKHKLSIIAACLEKNSPLERLTHGYSYITGPQGNNIKSIFDVSQGDLLNIRLADGEIKARVETNDQ